MANTACSVHPIPEEHRGHGGGTLRSAHALRAVRQFAWLGVGTVKAALSRPTHLPLTQVVGRAERVSIE
jgi:hypothetical protein